MSIFQIAKNRLVAEIRRVRNKDFLEAARVAGALLAAADKEVLISERFADPSQLDLLRPGSRLTEG